MKTKFRRTSSVATAFAGLAVASAAVFGEPRLAPVSGTPAGTKSLPAHIAGTLIRFIDARHLAR